MSEYLMKKLQTVALLWIAALLSVVFLIGVYSIVSFRTQAAIEQNELEKAKQRALAEMLKEME